MIVIASFIKVRCGSKVLHIAEYSHGTTNNHDPIRDRKLLLQKREISKIEGKAERKRIYIDPSPDLF
jgi:SsrA-binding protein